MCQSWVTGRSRLFVLVWLRGWAMENLVAMSHRLLNDEVALAKAWPRALSKPAREARKVRRWRKRGEKLAQATAPTVEQFDAAAKGTVAASERSANRVAGNAALAFEEASHRITDRAARRVAAGVAIGGTVPVATHHTLEAKRERDRAANAS